MRDRIEAVVLEGQHLRVTAREPVGVEPRMLALAAAVRAFEQYPALDRLTLAVGGSEVVIGRDEVHRLLGADGFGPLKDRERFRQFLTRAVAPGDGADGGREPGA